MRTYIRQSIKLNNNTRMITHYTPSEYIGVSLIHFVINAIGFLLYWTFVFPIKFMLWLGTFIINLIINLIVLIVKIVVRLLIILWALIKGFFKSIIRKRHG